MNERDFTQKEFAAFLETTETTVSNWMTGASSPGLDSLVNIAVKTGYSTDKLIGHVPPGVEVLEKLRQQAGAVFAAISSLVADEAIVTAAAREVAERERTPRKKERKTSGKTVPKGKGGKRA